jgi:hypothetical protein
MAKRILLVSGKPERYQEIESGFRNDPEVKLHGAASLAQAENVMASNRFGMGDLVILDEMIDGRPALDAAKKIILKNAFVYLAVFSDLPADRFHEVAEGLGILAQLPSRPTEADFNALMQRWNAASAVSGG